MNQDISRRYHPQLQQRLAFELYMQLSRLICSIRVVLRPSNYVHSPVLQVQQDTLSQSTLDKRWVRALPMWNKNMCLWQKQLHMCASDLQNCVTQICRRRNQSTKGQAVTDSKKKKAPKLSSGIWVMRYFSLLVPLYALLFITSCYWVGTKQMLVMRMIHLPCPLRLDYCLHCFCLLANYRTAFSSGDDASADAS